MDLLYFIVVGLVAGWLAGQFMRGGGYGLVGNIIVGMLGAVVGGYLFRSLGASMGGGLLGSIVVAAIGAIVMLFVVRLFSRGARISANHWMRLPPHVGRQAARGHSDQRRGALSWATPYMQ